MFQVFEQAVYILRLMYENSFITEEKDSKLCWEVKWEKSTVRNKWKSTGI